MRFLIDMPLSPELVHWLGERGHDACHAAAIGMWNAPDIAVIEYARADHRVIITADLDYPRILAVTDAGGPGLILFRGGQYSDAQIRERLESAFRAVPVEDLPHLMIVIEKTRIRCRRLPLK